MKIKDRIVKWLGGYTKDEYMFLAMKPLEFKTETRKIDTLKAKRHISIDMIRQDAFYEVVAKEELVKEILREVRDQGYVRLYTEQSEVDGYITISGKIDVVRRYHD